MRFQDKVVVVTGGASGIGFASAKLFAAEGAIVAVNDSRAEAVAAAVQTIQAAGGRAFAIPGDVSDLDQVRDNARTVMARHGRIDILLNNAGIAPFAPAETVSADEWRKVLAVNLDGVFYWAQTVAVQSMIPNRSGVIVNVASTAGLAAIPNAIAYVASKHGVVGISKTLAVEWGHYGIRVNCLCPGLTETDMLKDVRQRNPEMIADREKRVPVERSCEPEEQAQVVAFLASPQASYVHGLIMNVDGGQLALFSGYSLPAGRSPA